MADSLSRRPDMREELNFVYLRGESQLNAIEYALELNKDVANIISRSYSHDKELSPIIKKLSCSDHSNLHERYCWDKEARYLYLRAAPSNRLCIPNCSIRLKLLQEYHDCATAGHSGRDRTYFRLAQFFYWPKMGLDVKRFVKSCDICQRTKGSKLRSGLLQSLPIPDTPWKDISMDFITGLPRTSQGWDAIYTFVDRLTKCVHLVPTSSSVDAKGSAQLYVDNVFRLHGLSSSIVCDRDPRFTAEFFRHVFQQLGTTLSFSTANHPQSDGQTERMNKLVEDILRAFVNHKQDNWDRLLPLCEFAINSSFQSSTANTPFFLNYGYNPRSPPDFLVQTNLSSESGDWLKAQRDALKVAYDSLVAAQARQALYADRNRQPSCYKVGDKVLVYRDFLLTPEARCQPSHKLRPKWFGPFTISKKVGSNAYRLELPQIIRSHPVFNVTALRPYNENSIPGRRQPAPPPITDLDGNTRYMVEAILDHREHKGKRQYLVKWQGYPQDESTWEPAENLLDESGKDIVQLRQYWSSKARK